MPRAKQSTWALEAVLWCGILFAVAFLVLGVVQVVSSDGIDTRAVWFNPYSTSTPADDPLQTSAAAAPGTVSMVTPSFNRTIVVASPTFYQRFLLAVPDLLTALILGAVAVVFLRVVRTVRTDDPFVMANVRRLNIIGALLIAPMVAVPLVEKVAMALLVDGSPLDGTTFSGMDEFRWAGVVGIAVLTLGQVFKHGARLRADTEGLV
ncbi:DUF2975 domain-containing protein [Nonomuraea sp. NPDC059194]|uniref:DUF2975 domain-containing protein n=1 Tax=Nonomuraea sp. NPDC059194 TaxID=3346764 RepID=UPI0036BC46C3